MVRPRAARRGRGRHRDRRCEDGDALLQRDHRGRRRLARGASAAARRRPGHGGELGCAASGGRRGRGARRTALSARDRGNAEPARGAGAHRLGRISRRAGRGPRRAGRAGGARHRRPRGRAGRPPLRREGAPPDPVRAAATPPLRTAPGARTPRRSLHSSRAGSRCSTRRAARRLPPRGLSRRDSSRLARATVRWTCLDLATR